MDKRKLIKIILPLCIVLVIMGIWIYKNLDTEKGMDQPISQDNAELADINEDFILEATEIDLDTLTSYGLPIIIDFGAHSCVPCKEMEPVLETMNAQMQGRAIIKFVDVWENNAAAADFPIQVIPTQVFINADGAPYVPSDDLGIEFIMYSEPDTKTHVFTVHQGGLTEEQMNIILTDMGVSE